MKQMRNWVGVVLSGSLAAVSFGLLTGCADDLYAPCDLDSSSPDLAVRTCGDTTGTEDKSCVVENQVQCDTRVCGRYGGSDAFCTKKCSEDDDCPSGYCLEFVYQSGAKYCVENQLVDG